MPGVFILVLFPAMLLGAILIIMSLGLSGLAAISMVLLVALVGVVFVSLAISMLHQHPSQDLGDRRLSEDRFASVEKELGRDAVPEEIEEEDDDLRGRALERWGDDGGYRSPIDPR